MKTRLTQSWQAVFCTCGFICALLGHPGLMILLYVPVVLAGVFQLARIFRNAAR
jgi:hypothetical protein